MDLKQPDFDSEGLYTDLSLLAVGGRGATWHGKDALTGNDVLLKVRPRSDDAEQLARREARVFRNINHPNLQSLESFQANRDHLILRYGFVRGESLADVIRNKGPLPPNEAESILKGTLLALQELHSNDIAHRDISPNNIILSGQGPVLIDFDAAGFLDESSPIGATTIVGDFAGTLMYMSPEGLAGAPQNTATDIWALGAVYFEMITGATLRKGSTISEILAESLQNPDLAEVVEPNRSLLLRMLTLDAAQRPSAMELLGMLPLKGLTDDLMDFAAPAAVIMPKPTPPPSLARSTGHGTIEQRSQNKHRPQSLLIALIAVVFGSALLLLGLGNAAWLSIDVSADILVGLGLVLIGIALGSIGIWLFRRQIREPTEGDISENLMELIGVDGVDGRKALMRTVIGNLEPEVARGGVVPVQIAALAQEYVGAKSSPERLEALKVLIDVHHRASVKNRSVWRSPERLVQWGISLTSLVGGAVAAYEGVSRLF